MTVAEPRGRTSVRWLIGAMEAMVSAQLIFLVYEAIQDWIQFDPHDDSDPRRGESMLTATCIAIVAGLACVGARHGRRRDDLTAIVFLMVAIVLALLPVAWFMLLELTIP